MPAFHCIESLLIWLPPAACSWLVGRLVAPCVKRLDVRLGRYVAHSAAT